MTPPIPPAILVTGATGFTGRFVCQELRRRQWPFTCLVRPSSDTTWLAQHSIPWVTADLTDGLALKQAFAGFQTLINVASLGFGWAPGVIAACQAQHLQRAVFVSTTALFTKLNARSKAMRQAAESAIQTSGLNYTILRPTMIYGTPGDRNMVRLLRLIQRSPIIPVFGDGQSYQQPVYVADLAWAICEVINHPHTIGRDYNLSGGQVLTYNQVIETAARALGRSLLILHLPAQPIIYLLETLERFHLPLPLKGEQIRRLNEDKTFSHSLAQQDFGYHPRSFATGIAMEVELLKEGRRATGAGRKGE
jgi:nucleoside-diphosphate-sugar epimerase